MLDTVDEFEVAALHKWIELISDPDADIPHDLGNNFIRFVKYLTVTGKRIISNSLRGLQYDSITVSAWPCLAVA